MREQPTAMRRRSCRKLVPAPNCLTSALRSKSLFRSQTSQAMVMTELLKLRSVGAVEEFFLIVQISYALWTKGGYCFEFL